MPRKTIKKAENRPLSPLEIMDAYLKPFMESTLISGDYKTAPTEPLLHVWAILKYTNERIESTLKEVRVELLERAATRGRPTDRGGHRIGIDGSEIIREKRVNALPATEPMKTLLGEHNIDVNKAFSKTVQMELDSSKIQLLIDQGFLKKGDVDKLRKVTWALRIRESDELMEAIESSIGDLQEEEEELVIIERKKRRTARGSRK